MGYSIPWFPDDVDGDLAYLQASGAPADLVDYTRKHLRTDAVDPVTGRPVVRVAHDLLLATCQSSRVVPAVRDELIDLAMRAGLVVDMVAERAAVYAAIDLAERIQAAGDLEFERIVDVALANDAGVSDADELLYERWQRTWPGR